MSDLRAFCRPESPEPTVLRLDPGESHHLVRTNRARPGDTVVVFDGRGHEWVCSLEDDDRAGAVLRVRLRQTVPPLPYRLALAQALPKGRQMADIVRRATEIGVTDIHPLESERVVVHLGEGREERRLEKWQTAALEACKQCGNAWLPAIHPVRTVAEFCAAPPPAEARLIASLQPGARHLRRVLASLPGGSSSVRSAVWMIGPEGDFTPAEMALAAGAGFLPVSLGPLVLRCETAAVHALAILSHELQDRA